MVSTLSRCDHRLIIYELSNADIIEAYGALSYVREKSCKIVKKKIKAYSAKL